MENRLRDNELFRWLVYTGFLTKDYSYYLSKMSRDLFEDYKKKKNCNNNYNSLDFSINCIMFCFLLIMLDI